MKTEKRSEKPWRRRRWREKNESGSSKKWRYEIISNGVISMKRMAKNNNGVIWRNQKNGEHRKHGKRVCLAGLSWLASDSQCVTLSVTASFAGGLTSCCVAPLCLVVVASLRCCRRIIVLSSHFVTHFPLDVVISICIFFFFFH